MITASLLTLAVLVPASPAEPPHALPQNATGADLKWQPALDHNYTGPSEDCRDKSDLDSTNAYSRQRCNSGWCVHLYDYYFEKDVAVPQVADAGGHRHDWEHIAVWVQDGQAKYVAASAHGAYQIEKAEDVRWEGTHPNIVYHKDGGLTHAFRFATEGDEPPENHYDTWRRSPLVSYLGFPSGLRDTPFTHDFGSASIGIKDSSFAGNLERAVPAEWTQQCSTNGTNAPICTDIKKVLIEFDYGLDEGSPGDPNPAPGGPLGNVMIVG